MIFETPAARQDEDVFYHHPFIRKEKNLCLSQKEAYYSQNQKERKASFRGLLYSVCALSEE
jgi:hypothetical protein